MTRRLILSYLAITLFTLLILEIPLGRFIAGFELARLETGFERNATILATIYEDALDNNHAFSPAPAANYAAEADVRVVVVDIEGRSIVDTEQTVNKDFSNRPEIQAALDGQRVADTRDSVTLGRPLSYVAVPVASGGEVHGAVRITFNPAEVGNRIDTYWRRLIAIGVVVLASVAAVGWIIARSVTRPLRAIKEAVVAVGAGDLSRRIDPADAPEEVAALARGFNSMAQRLDALMARQRRFVADASHELRTPLTALRLRLENLAGEVGPDENLDLEAALAETDRLSLLVDQLLTIARTEDGTPDLVATDLVTEVGARVELWAGLASESRVDLTFDAGSERPTVFMPSGAVDQIVDNLVSNAIAATPEDGAVQVVVSAENEAATMIVTDTGRGMTEEERAAAFDRFWRADHSSEGTGLGLAIVRDLAEGVGGTATIAGGPKGGTAVSIRIPLPSTSPSPIPRHAGRARRVQALQVKNLTERPGDRGSTP